MTLQLHYDIARTKREQYAGQHPDRTKFRPVLFWDVDPQKIDWHKNRSFVIQRVFERGEEQEIEEAIRFYGARRFCATCASTRIPMRSI